MSGQNMRGGVQVQQQASANLSRDAIHKEYEETLAKLQTLEGLKSQVENEERMKEFQKNGGPEFIEWQRVSMAIFMEHQRLYEAQTQEWQLTANAEIVEYKRVTGEQVLEQQRLTGLEAQELQRVSQTQVEEQQRYSASESLEWQRLGQAELLEQQRYAGAEALEWQRLAQANKEIMDTKNRYVDTENCREW